MVKWRAIALVVALLTTAPLAPRANAKASAPAWRGEPTWIGGTSRYDGGDWVYQDFVYDDGFRANNTADIVHVRARLRGRDLELRVTLNSLFDASSAVIGAALASGDDPARPWPFGAGVSSRWGSFATVVDGVVHHSAADSPPMSDGVAAIDLGEHTIAFTMALPDRQPKDVSLNIGAGAWDASAGTWSTHGVLDLGFNRHELEPVPIDFMFSNERVFRDQHQQRAIDEGDVSAFDHSLDLGLLRTKHVDPRTTGSELMGEPEPAPSSDRVVAVPSYAPKMVPYPGQNPYVVNRVYRSIQDMGGGYGPPGGGSSLGGNAPHPMAGLYQTYRITIPPGYDGTDPRPLNLLLPAMAGNHNSHPAQSVTDRMGGDLGAFTVTPLALGSVGWYADESLVDTLQALADVQQHYVVDRERISMAGYSMGGGGVYRLATLFPDLFASGVVWVGYTNRPAIDQLENAQHVPLMIIHGTNDETVPLDRVLPYTDRLHELGYEYRFNLHPGFDHFALWLTDEWTRERDWVAGRHRAVNPANVTFKVRPSAWASGPRAPAIIADLRTIAEQLGTSIDGAYWVSGVVVEGDNDDPIGAVNLTSAAVAARTPVRNEVLAAMPGPPAPYIQRGISRTYATGTVSNTLAGTLSGVRELTVDLERAGLTLADLHVDVVADRDTTLHLREGKITRTVSITGNSQ